MKEREEERGKRERVGRVSVTSLPLSSGFLRHLCNDVLPASSTNDFWYFSLTIHSGNRKSKKLHYWQCNYSAVVNKLTLSQNATLYVLEQNSRDDSKLQLANLYVRNEKRYELMADTLSRCITP